MSHTHMDAPHGMCAAGAESCLTRCTSSTLAKVLTRSVNGLVTIWLYFMDVISDIEVTKLVSRWVGR